MSKDPQNWAEVKPRDEVTITWTFMNTGTKEWGGDDIVLVYYDGAKLTPPEHKKKLLGEDVKVGQTITPFVNIYTPKESGHYRSVWALRVIETNQVFCTFTIKIFVPYNYLTPTP